MKKRRIIRLTLGILGFLLIHVSLSFFYLGTFQRPKWAAENYAYFQKLPPQIETLLLGDSHIRVNIKPLKLHRAYGLAGPGQSYIEDYYRLRTVIAEAKHPLKLVILPMEMHSFAE